MNTWQRRAALVTAATELYREKGISNTTISDITERVGVTRSLFYHYFADKQAITNAVIEDSVDGFVRIVHEECSQIDPRNIRASLELIALTLQTYLLESGSVNNCVLREQNASLWQQFTILAANKLSVCFAKNANLPGTLASQARVSHPKESAYVLTVGLISLVSRNPNTSRLMIADLIADTLRYDLC